MFHQSGLIRPDWPVAYVHHAEDEHADEEPVRELEQAVVLPANPVDRGDPHRERAQRRHPARRGVDAWSGGRRT